MSASTAFHCMASRRATPGMSRFRNSDSAEPPTWKASLLCGVAVLAFDLKGGAR